MATYFKIASIFLVILCGMASCSGNENMQRPPHIPHPQGEAYPQIGPPPLGDPNQNGENPQSGKSFGGVPYPVGGGGYVPPIGQYYPGQGGFGGGGYGGGYSPYGYNPYHRPPYYAQANYVQSYDTFYGRNGQQ